MHVFTVVARCKELRLREDDIGILVQLRAEPATGATDLLSRIAAWRPVTPPALKNMKLRAAERITSMLHVN
jgi:hypothetical protein